MVNFTSLYIAFEPNKQLRGNLLWVSFNPLFNYVPDSDERLHRVMVVFNLANVLTFMVREIWILFAPFLKDCSMFILAWWSETFHVACSLQTTADF